ncbi:hypothetical protein RJ60_14105 [Mesotoga sp. B105.6.4]|nr:hypothetical protein RJ60_14105 [Mesotoga sp. B105.6.4]
METDEMTRLRGTLSRKGSKQPGLTRSVLTPRHLLTLPFLRSVESKAWRVVNNRQSPPALVSLRDASTTPSRKQTGEGKALLAVLHTLL